MSASLSKPPSPVPTLPDGESQDPASDSPRQLSALLADARPIVWTSEQLLAAQAMQFLIRLDGELLEARAQWNQDWFRRIMRIRPKAALRLRRRWAKLDPTPVIPLGSLRRRYHANLERHLYERTQ